MTLQDRHPNFREDGRLYLVRCFACGPQYGRENWAMAVASGMCAWCGWSEEKEKSPEPPVCPHCKLELDEDLFCNGCGYQPGGMAA